ncbi:hypothetical protein PIB30_024982 [Stylosanthes scabra]|uniref:Uncharacterized protein n=1 Tax=Stylosanthes scabra TaxID=79078 RepID=A0ABU6YA93_9FABA|nr:hypothetical protein [Stylosanthes scabra]
MRDERESQKDKRFLEKEKARVIEINETKEERVIRPPSLSPSPLSLLVLCASPPPPLPTPLCTRRRCLLSPHHFCSCRHSSSVLLVPAASSSILAGSVHRRLLLFPHRYVLVEVIFSLPLHTAPSPSSTHHSPSLHEYQQ